MKTKLMAVMLVAGASAFAQGQFGQDIDAGPDYNSAQGNPGYDDPAYGSPSYNEPQSYGGAPEYYSQAPAGAYGAPPLCAPGTVWIDGYDGVNGYCAVPPYSGAFWIGPRYFGGRFIAGYWGGPRGFVGGRGFRGGMGFAGRNDFRGGAFGGRGFAGAIFSAARLADRALPETMTTAAERKARGLLVVAQTSEAERQAAGDLPPDSLAAAGNGAQAVDTPGADTDR